MNKEKDELCPEVHANEATAEDFEIQTDEVPIYYGDSRREKKRRLNEHLPVVKGAPRPKLPKGPGLDGVK